MTGTTFCQTCRDVAVSRFLSLGRQPDCLFPANPAEAERERLWPLDLGFCRRCGLVQVMEPVDGRILFAGDHHHVTALAAGYRRHLRELAELIATAAPRGPVVEIGSNHGVLLDELVERGHAAVGVDPNGVRSPGGQPVVREFFGTELATRLLSAVGPADVVVALSTLAHVADLHDVLSGVRSILRADGVFVSESHYLPDFLEALQYDFACHEHYRYYSMTALAAAFARHGLEIFRAERTPIHGGSLRVYAGVEGAHDVDGSVASIRGYEDSLRLTDDAVHRVFAARVAEHRDRLRGLLNQVRSDGSRVAAASSPARAATLLTYCALGPADIEFISEINPRKIGALSPGTHIPVVPQSRLCGPDQPEYALLPAWHIADELMSRLRDEGFTGRFVIPLPEPRIVGD